MVRYVPEKERFDSSCGNGFTTLDETIDRLESLGVTRLLGLEDRQGSDMTASVLEPPRLDGARSRQFTGRGVVRVHASRTFGRLEGEGTISDPAGLAGDLQGEAGVLVAS